MMLCLLLDLLSAAEADQTLWIGYSRGKFNYVGGGCYWDAGSQSPLLSYSHYLSCIAFLEESELIETRTATAGFTRYSSRMKATPILIDRFRHHEMNWSIVSESNSAPAIIVKDEDKRPIAWPKSGNFDLQKAIENLDRINTNLNSTFINLNISDEELNLINERSRATPDSGEEEEIHDSPIDFSWRTLKRVFAMSSFANGGRFYGGWWQGLPSEYRKYIEIDGAVTVELDYATIQPRILYASIGMLPPPDSYVLPEWGDEYRPVVKKTFSQLLNSDESSKNPNQWHRFAPALDPEPLPESWSSMSRFEKDQRRRNSFQERTGRDYSELIADLLNYHRPIEKDFFSSVWGATQNLDSQIAERVLIKMLDEEIPITALPIHDSFIVRRLGEEQLRRAMIDSFNEIINSNVKISRDETVFDRPAGYDGPSVIVADEELHLEVRKMVKTHSGYFRRCRQWEREWGPL